nr:PT domain-containing protein [Eubacterium sp.]
MKKNRKQISILLIFSMIFTTVFTSMSPEVCAEEVTGVTVTTQEQFMSALNQGQSPIIVDGVITIGKEADSSGKMQPVVIPAGTVIKGTSNGSLNSRGPIQLGGDNVCFQDIELTFSSSSALGSVPHREIFLAGYALTLDNVSTYLEGAGGNLGGLGGSESELLPTVYAGAFEGTAVLGDNASLIVQNANSDTQFQGIYMGHDAGTDNKIPYAGQATVQLDCPFVATEGIHTEENTSASITIVGDGTAIAPAFYGNDATTLTIDTCTTTQTEIDGVGTIVLDNGAWLQAKTTNLNHVTVKNGACLDFSELSDAISLKSFTGISASSATETKGILSLDTEGSLTITGDVEGIAIFQTGGPALPGTVYAEHPYIKTGQPEEDEINFVFPQKTIDNGFELQYSEGAWTAVSTYSGLEIGEIRIDEAPESVNVETIVRDGESDVPNESAYFRITWYDKNGGAYSNEDAEYNVLYQYDYVIAIKTEYWQSGDAEVAEKEDWGNPIYLMSKEDQSGKYYLYAEEGVKTGDYTFLFLSEYYDMYNPPVTVGDVKALQEKVLAQCRVLFYDSETGVPTPAPTVAPTAKPTVMPTAIPTVAPTAKPTVMPTAIPTVAPTA